MLSRTYVFITLYWKGLLANAIEVKGLEIDPYDDSNLIKKNITVKSSTKIIQDMKIYSKSQTRERNWENSVFSHTVKDGQKDLWDKQHGKHMDAGEDQGLFPIISWICQALDLHVFKILN